MCMIKITSWVKITSRVQVVSHQQYVDSIMLFGKGNIMEAKVNKKVLKTSSKDLRKHTSQVK